MAHAVGVTPDELRRTGRTEAADMLAALEAPPASPSVSSDFTSDPHIDAIASLLATLPPEAQEEVLRRVRLTEAAKPREEHTDNQFRRRAV
ncbi:hypothetical protein [Streptomyces sp. NWU339]|uniref:hypothetical protein n=1 Tax=Streptomyces sp. NWU339 TaxID=2185284 RepID=UPI0035C7C050